MSATKRMQGVLHIALQTGLLGVLWLVTDYASRHFRLPLPGSVLGLAVMLLLLFSGRVAPRWVKAGADWLLSDMLLFFVPAAVAAVQYGGLFKSDGWRLALVVVAGTLTVMVAVAFAVDQAARLERRLAMRRVRVSPPSVR
jgi:holin-like protein